MLAPPWDSRSGGNDMKTRRGIAVIGILSLVVTACSASPGASPSPAATAGSAATAGPAATSSPAGPAATSSPAGSAAVGGTAVKITLSEWAVASDVTTAKAGPVTFTASNTGPADEHEFVVIKTDLSFIDLPTDATGAVKEDGGGMEVSGEIEGIAVGASEDKTLTLQPGAYALICNVYDEAKKEAHYQMGMRMAFTVTQ
jgi:uncharacterized cupredoxin-like copper-binding protein